MDLSAIGRQFGLDEQQTRSAFEALAPVVAAGVRRNAAQPSSGGGGLADLLGGLAGGNPTRYADDLSAFGQPEAVDDGNAVLGQIFGSKDVSRGVAQQLSGTTGISDSILKKLLPIVAAFVMSQIAKKAMGGSTSSGGGGLGDILGSVLGGGQSQPAPQPQAQPQGGGLGDILGDILGGGQQKQPSGGQQGGGLGDILGSILGGGQQQPSGGQQGGGLGDILGDLLGGAQNRGGGGGGNSAEDLLNSVEQALRRR